MHWLLIELALIQARPASRQSPFHFMMKGKLDGEEIGLELIEGYKVSCLGMECLWFILS